MTSRLLAFLCVLVGTSVPLHAATLQFSTRQDIPTRFQHLTGLAIADFNGDGVPDIAVTDDYAQKIVVYLNKGNGTFSTVTTTLNVSGIGGLGALVTGDLNEDGKPDLIVAPVAGNQVDIVLIGNGDGTFTQGALVPGSYGFQSAALLDINGDKHLDLVSGQNGSAYVALGDGKGNFTQETLAGQIPSDLYTGLATGDFNGDGHQDFILSGSLNSSVLLFPGNGDGSFQAPVALNPSAVYNPLSLASADFNADGKQDLVIGSANLAQLLLGNGDGTFQTGGAQITLPLPQGSAPSGLSQTPPLVTAADMDVNGTYDIVAADNTSNMVSVLLNNGAGTFLQAPDFTAALDAGSNGLQVADLNMDGLPDIIVTNSITGNISIFLSIAPKRTPALVVTSSALQSLVGASPTITVQVNGTLPNPPTGTVTLSVGSVSLATQTLNAGGQATFTLTGLTAGQYVLSAAYSGDANFAAFTDSTVTEDVTDFQLSLPSPSETVKAGASATFPLTLSALSGFTGSVAISCAGLPTGYTCTPSTATLSTASSTVNVVVSPPPTLVELRSGPSLLNRQHTIAVFAVLGLCFFSRKRRKLPVLLPLLALTCFAGLSGCSNGSSPAKVTPYTGTSTFTITATATQGTATVSHQVTATLIVQ